MRVSLFKETININEDGKMRGLNVFGYWVWDLRVFFLQKYSQAALSGRWLIHVFRLSPFHPSPYPNPLLVICQNSHSVKKLAFLKVLTLSMLITSILKAEKKVYRKKKKSHSKGFWPIIKQQKIAYGIATKEWGSASTFRSSELTRILPP